MVKFGPFSVVVGSGNIVRETRDVRDFDEINLGGSGEVHITQTGEESLAIEADDNVLPVLTTEVHGRRLELGTRRGININLHRSPHYYITVKSLRGLIISGSGKLDVTALTTDTLAISISGSGKVDVTALAAEALDVSISGSGSIALAGQAARLNLHISGAGSYDAPDLASGTARVHISGSGSANLTVADTLDLGISGSGSVRYGGQPTITKSISGSGSIRRRD
jgi:hypothetical protein